MIILAALAAPILINAAMNRLLARRYPPLGRLYLVAGRHMHLYCLGSGSPTVLLEAGSGDDLLYWQTIQPALSRVSRVCSYDRAGLGWSEPRSGEHDAVAIARQLHQLLEVATVPRPLVLVGASAGGYYVREYTREYPAEVAGVVFLDASSPRQLDELPNSRAWFNSRRRLRWAAARSEKLKVWLGWQRLTGKCHDDVPEPLAAFRGNYDALACRPTYVDGDLPEWSEFDTSANEAARITTFGQIPLLVMSQDPDRPKPGWTADAIAAQPIWSREQELLKAMSAQSWRVIARGAPHHIHESRPELVVSQITLLIECVRGGCAASPWGTTTVQ